MTTQHITPFLFEGQSLVRVIERSGEPWFVLADACGVLEIGNPSDAARRLDDDEKGVDTIDTLGGPQSLVIINESGLYSLILTSRKPAAKRFKKWVTAEVLPNIRKTGSYHSTHNHAESLIAAGRLDVMRLNAATRAITQLVRIGGPRAASMNAAAIYDRVGLRIDMSLSSAFDQGVLPFGRSADSLQSQAAE